MIRYGLVRAFFFFLFPFASLFLLSLSLLPSLDTLHASAEIGNYFQTGRLCNNERKDTRIDGIVILVGLLIGLLIN